MKLYPHPRPSIVLQRVRGLLVSLDQRLSHGSLASSKINPLDPPRRSTPVFRASKSAQLSRFQAPLHPFRPIQST
jgi:hypothetical protein